MMSKWLSSALVTGVCLSALALPPSAVAALLTPAAPTVAAGDSVTLTLQDTIAAGSGIGAVDVQVTFDHSKLSLVSVADGSLLVGWDAPTFNPTNGAISIGEDLGDEPSGTGSVLTLTFAAFSGDLSTSTLVSAQTYPSSAVGAEGEYQLAPTTASIAITAATTPTPAPEPGTVALLLGPMLAAASLKRRSRG